MGQCLPEECEEERKENELISSGNAELKYHNSWRGPIFLANGGLLPSPAREAHKIPLSIGHSQGVTLTIVQSLIMLLMGQFF